MASIEEVAREAGVSITTVSHVFSGKRPVAAETRGRVLAAARRLGYRPSRAAKGLATGRSMTIGLHFPFEGESVVLDPFYLELLQGLSAAAAESGYGFLLISSEPKRFPLRKALEERQFDGVIAANPTADSPLIPVLLARRVPLVTVGRYPVPGEVPWVDNDHRGGIAQLMAHLEEQGYERPALISFKSTISYNEDAEESFEKEVRARGGEVSIVHATGDYSEEQGFLLALRLLSQSRPPDAIVADTDRMAIGVLRAARELRLRVPQDLGIAGVDDTVLARHSNPRLTSIRLRPHVVGDAAMDSLLAIVERGEVPENRLLPAELVPRASTRRVRRRPSGA
jgi:DNA-binding LacI/PurR family transcriptional regulator